MNMAAFDYGIPFKHSMSHSYLLGISLACGRILSQSQSSKEEEYISDSETALAKGT